MNFGFIRHETRTPGFHDTKPELQVSMTRNRNCVTALKSFRVFGSVREVCTSIRKVCTSFRKVCTGSVKYATVSMKYVHISSHWEKITKSQLVVVSFLFACFRKVFLFKKFFHGPATFQFKLFKFSLRSDFSWVLCCN